MFASKNVKRMIAFAVAMAIIFVTLFSFIYGAEHVENFLINVKIFLFKI